MQQLFIETTDEDWLNSVDQCLKDDVFNNLSKHHYQIQPSIDQTFSSMLVCTESLPKDDPVVEKNQSIDSLIEISKKSIKTNHWLKKQRKRVEKRLSRNLWKYCIHRHCIDCLIDLLKKASIFDKTTHKILSCRISQQDYKSIMFPSDELFYAHIEIVHNGIIEESNECYKCIDGCPYLYKKIKPAKYKYKRTFIEHVIKWHLNI